MKNATIILAVLAVVALAVPAYGTHYWTGDDTGNNYWNDADNWDQPAPPAAGDFTRISDVTAADPVVLQSTTTAYFGVLQFGHWGKAAHMSVYGNMTQNDTQNFDLGCEGGENYSVITQYSGAVAPSYHMALGSVWNTTGKGYGRYIIEGGSLDGPSYRQLRLGYRTSDGLQENTAGHLIVVGSGPTSISYGHYNQSSTSTLEFQFDGDDDPIQQIDIANDVTLAGTLKITGTASTTGGPNSDGEYVIMTYGGTKTGTWTEDLSAGWSVAYGSGSVTATYVPEPATMCLLGIGGIGVLIRRRSRA